MQNITSTGGKYEYYFEATRPAFVTRLLQRKHRHLFDLCVRDATVDSVVEIGPGEGFFAQSCREAGVSYLALESSAVGVAALQKQGFDVIQATLPPFPSSISQTDLVYASHLIEHLPNPDAVLDFMTQARAALRPGGRLAFAYPDARWMRMDFWDADYTHSWPSTPRRVAQVARDAGFEVAKHYDCCLHFDGWRATVLRALMKLYPQRTLASIDSSRADFWYRGKLLFVPDALTILTPR